MTTTEEGFFKENNWAHGTRVVHAGFGFGGTAGMITFGTISGGAGAALTGGNFWQGAVTGLIVSGLNHAMHMDGPKPKQKTVSFKDQLNSFVRGLDISTSTKELILSFGGEEAEEMAPKFFRSSLKGLGAVAGAYAIRETFLEYLENPSTANLLKLTVTTGVVAVSIFSSGGIFTNSVAFGISIFNDTQMATDMYNYLGNQIDNLAGHSVGNQVYNGIKGSLNLIHN